MLVDILWTFLLGYSKPRARSSLGHDDRADDRADEPAAQRAADVPSAPPSPAQGMAATEEVLASHVRDLREGDDKAKLWAAMALRTLGGLSSEALEAAGAVPPLISLMRDGSKRAKIHAAKVLWNYLAYIDAHLEKKDLVIEVVRFFVELVKNDDAGEGASALHVIAKQGNVKYREAIVIAGGLPPLVKLSIGGHCVAWSALHFLSTRCRHHGSGSNATDEEIAVAIAAVVGWDALAQLARNGSVILRRPPERLIPYRHPRDQFIIQNANAGTRDKAARRLRSLIRPCLGRAARVEIAAAVIAFL